MHRYILRSSISRTAKRNGSAFYKLIGKVMEGADIRIGIFIAHRFAISSVRKLQITAIDTFSTISFKSVNSDFF